MGISRVDYDGDTLVDLSNDSVTPETLALGETAHDANGNPISGKAKLCTVTLDVADAPPVVDDRLIITFVVG